MRQQTRTSLLWVAILLFVLAVGAILGTSIVIQPKAIAENDVILSQTFDGTDVPAGWEELIGSVEDGMGRIKTGGLYSIPLTSDMLAESNNYEVSFDIVADAQSSDDAFYFHIVGLNGDTGENIYFKANNNGQFWCMTDFGYHPIYNNSGEDHGGLNGSGVDLTEKHTIKFVHFDGYCELWIDGTRRIVSHLSHFGNNNYDTRIAITEGTITGFAFDARTGLKIDNVVVKEATGKETSYMEHSINTTTGSTKTFPLSAQNLYNGNFEIVGKFAYADISVSNYYPTIGLYGLNNATGDERNGNHYGVAFQAYADREFITPQIFAKKPDTSWASADGTAVTCTQEDGFEYRIQVFGDNIRYYVNDELKIETTFTSLGIEKGYLQYIRIQSGGGGAYWTDFSYQGYETETAVTIEASTTRAKLGEEVTFTATMFGAETAEEFVWYIDDVAQETESGLTLTVSDLTEGTHTIKYASTSFISNEITVEVFDNMITIEADITSAYATEDITVTAELSGNFEDDKPVWYLDNEPLEEESETLVLHELSVGTHKVVLKNSTVTSNEIEITIKEGVLKLDTVKNNYLNTETATIEAKTTGVLETDTLTWKINGQVQDGVADKTLSLDLSAYNKGEVITVECATASGLESSVTINIYFNILEEISANDNYKTLNSIELKAGETYGNYACKEDESGNYLYSTAEGAGWFSLSGAIPETMSFALNYEMYVPSEINNTNYSYPGFTGLNSKHPTGFVEIAIEVNRTGFRPYIKDQAAGVEYDVADYGFGVDLSYSGIAKKGDWNKVSYVVSGKYLAMYINDVQVYFVYYPNMTLPSAVSFNTFPDGGAGVPYIRFRNIEVTGITEEKPPVSSVICSVSATKVKVNETVALTANVSPYNAEYTTVEWYVNDQKVDCTTLTYTFKSDKAGSYKIYCKIDGISSAVKTITVEAGSDNDETNTGNKNSALIIGLSAGGGVLVLAGVAVAVVLVLKKRKNTVNADNENGATDDSSDNQEK